FGGLLDSGAPRAAAILQHMSPAATGPRLSMPALRPSLKPIALIALVLGLLFCSAPAANAADLFVDANGTLQYTGDPGRVSVVSFDEGPCVDDPNTPETPGTVCVSREKDDGDPIDETPNTDQTAFDDPNGTPCTRDDSPDVGQGVEAQYVCAGVERVEAEALDRDDTLSAFGLNDIPARLDGGDGNDQLFGGGGSGGDLEGGAGDDQV